MKLKGFKIKIGAIPPLVHRFTVESVSSVGFDYKRLTGLDWPGRVMFSVLPIEPIGLGWV